TEWEFAAMDFGFRRGVRKAMIFPPRMHLPILLARSWFVSILTAFCLLGSAANNSGNPFIAELTPAPGATVSELSSIEIVFSEPVEGVDSADLQVNGSAVAEMNQIAPEQFVFRFPIPPTGTVAFSWIPRHGIHAVDEPERTFAGGGWTNLLDPTLVYRDVII